MVLPNLSSSKPLFVINKRSNLTSFLLHRPFVIDLESTNGTMVNNEQIPVSRYYELKASDGRLGPLAVGMHLIPSLVLKFGQSTREYVLLQEDTS